VLLEVPGCLPRIPLEHSSVYTKLGTASSPLLNAAPD
jgi:hypothetical protein